MRLRRNGALFWVATAAFAVAALIGTTSCRQQPPPPIPHFDNLIIIMIDALRSDALPCYDYHRDTAPFMSRLAREGIQLQGYAVSSWTRTSVATLMTGLYPQRHQTTTRADSLPEQAPFLPDVLGRAGYDCRGYTANSTVGRKFGFSRGYSSFANHHGDKNDKPPAAAVGAIARDLVDGVKPPFFLNLHFLDTHEPYVPEQVWGDPTGDRAAYVQPADFRGRRGPLDSDMLGPMRDQYDGAILELDRELERLFAAFANNGLLENTLVIVTSDHGEEFGDHGGMTHGKTLHEEVLKVPFILWSQDGLSAYRSDQSFHQIDFLPTVLDALDVAAPSGLDGTSRWTGITVRGEIESDDPMLFFLDLGRRYALSIRAASSKLIHRHGSVTNQLYDLERDPAEKRNLLADSRKRAELLELLVVRHNALSKEGLNRRTTVVDGQARSQLVALGYMEADTTQEELRSRDIPARLQVYDSRVRGLFGNEDPADFAKRLDLSERSSQLLGGWVERTDEGCWTGPAASLVMPFETGGGGELVVAGLAPEGRRNIKLEIRIEGEKTGTWGFGAGEFAVRVPLGTVPPSRGFVYVDLKVSPTTTLTKNGKKIGLFVTSISVD